MKIECFDAKLASISVLGLAHLKIIGDTYQS